MSDKLMTGAMHRQLRIEKLQSVPSDNLARAHLSGQITPAQPLPLAVSPRQAARLSGVGRSTLYLALGAGELTSLKIGKRRLVMVEELYRWLTSHEVTL
jgi:excisionase family DNA binding protein